MEMQVEIRIKKCGISNQPDVCIFDDPCLSKFGALRGSCPHPGRQFVGLLCVSLMGTRQQMAQMPPLCRTKHNRAKPMSESVSALFSIADAGEFRFARFLYCLWRGAIRDTRKSAYCLRCVGHAPVGLSKRGRDTESDANIQPEEMLTFFSNEFSSAFPHEICSCVSYNI